MTATGFRWASPGSRSSGPLIHSVAPGAHGQVTKTGRSAEISRVQLGTLSAVHHGVNVVARSLVALSTFSALALAAPATGASAQAVPNAASPEHSPDPGNPVPPDEASDSIRQRSLRLRYVGNLDSSAELEAHEVILTRRLRAYGIALIAAVPTIVGGLWLASEYSPVFCKDCESRSTGHRAAGSFGWVLVALGVGALFVGLAGLPTAGARRNAARRRIRALELSPMAWFSPQESVGGAQLSLTW